MTTSASILVVEDDEDIRQLIAEYLGTQGYAVRTAATGAQARECLLAERPQLVILDIGLPDDDGLVIARHVREQLDIAIIIVSGANEPIDRIVGLEVGSDDYLSKPFDIRELRARVKNVLRRYRAPATPTAAAAPDPRRIELGRGTFDLDARMLVDGQGEEIPLTASEYDMLKVLVERPRRPLSRDQIMTLMRNREWDPFDRSIDICVARLRRKIERDPEHPEILKTVRGVGYMFVPPRRL